MDENNPFMQKAIASALEGIQKNHGGPFGACIVHKQKIVAVTHNTVLKDRDPTCHAEINAIRQACSKLNTHILSDCELFTTAEPCPMCLAAIYWARIPCIHIGTDKSTAANFGFDDAFFYEELLIPSSSKHIQVHRKIMEQECADVFSQWKSLDRPLY